MKESSTSRSGKTPGTPHEHAPAPDLGTELIPKERYTTAAYADAEWERMWKKVWLLAGMESDIPCAGDYLTFEVGRESILVVRQTDGSIAARYNVCMHRGNRLRDPGIGHVDRFVCSFHGWCYEKDGTLRGVQDRDSFPQGVPSETLSLKPVRSDTWGGFVWITMDPQAESLRDYLGIIPEHLDPYRFEEMSVASDVTVEVECNWKTSVDAFNESYHLACTHPATLEFTDDVGCQYDCYDRHTRMILPLAVASPRHPGHGSITTKIREYFMEPSGMDMADFDGDVNSVRSKIAQAIRDVQGPMMGADFSKLSDAQLNDDFHYTVFPNLTFNIHARFAWLFRHRPHPTDPGKMYFDFFNLVRAPALEIERPPHEDHVLADGYELAVLPGGDLLDEDMHNLPRLQAGMNSAAFDGLHLGNQEIRIRHFHRTLEGYVSGPERQEGQENDEGAKGGEG